MGHVSPFNHSFNPVDGARRHHRKRKGRPLVAGAGKVIANGKLRVELETVDGDIVTYIASPDMVWRFTPDVTARPRVSRVPAAATIVDKANLDTDALLDLFLAFERRVLVHGRVLVDLQRRVCALEDKPSHDNVVHLNSIAAE
jgi:hypothetical protein